MSTSPKVLVIDDDPTFCRMLEGFLSRKGMDSKGVFSGDQALEALAGSAYDIILSDYRLPDKDGIALLSEIREQYGPLPFIIMTSYADIRIAVQAMKLGAADYVTKPVNPDEILLSIRAALQTEPVSVTKEEPAAPSSKPGPKAQRSDGPTYIDGEGGISRTLQEHIGLVAPTTLSVLIHGESGSGKEFVARRIHLQSQRADKPFVSIDCGALSKELAASELFGHIKGSFTGAITDKTGQFEAAEGGTLFLDEIGNLGYDIQVQMLRAIQERRIRKIGSNTDVAVDVRIITATNEDLQAAVRKGDFREDLYHRLNEFQIVVPPLRERLEDLETFCAAFLEQAGHELGKEMTTVAPDAMEVFRRYSWPGNLRELRNVIRRAALLSKGESLERNALPPEMIREGTQREGEGDARANLKRAAGETEKELILQTLAKVNYNKSKAAQLLQIDRKTLYNKIKQYGIG